MYDMATEINLTSFKAYSDKVYYIIYFEALALEILGRFSEANRCNQALKINPKHI